MAQPLQPCPPNSFRFNSTLCACNPGYVFSATSNSCSLYQVGDGAWMMSSGVDYSLTFPETIFSFDSIKKFTQSQAVFLEATLVMLLSWLLFCFFVRFAELGDGRSIWFRIRWWISRLDFCFATRHWLDDRKVVMKRQTELGGTFSVASWILFVGLFAALLYQIISKRSVEVHNVKATNAPDLLSINNDMEFNITTISSMSCSHLRGLGTLISGNPGSIDFKVSPLSIFANYSCHNTSQGPTINLKCNSCQIIPDNIYISWQFVDLPNDPATAVGFQFNLTAKGHGDNKHVSFVSGILKNGSNIDYRPVTFRGADVNILKFHLFPRVYHNIHDLKLLQPLFHEFLPGSNFFEKSQLEASLQSSENGLINTTLYVNFLSSYIIEIDNQNILGPVSFLADLGGLYAISISIFFYFLVQCEYRIKRLRNEDGVMQAIRSRRRAERHWDKLRKYVMYTYGCNTLEDKFSSTRRNPICSCLMIESSHGNGSSHKTKQQFRLDSIHLSRNSKLPIQTSLFPESTQTHKVKSCLAGTTENVEGRSHSGCRKVLEHQLLPNNGNGEILVGPHEGNVSHLQLSPHNDSMLPPPPVLDFRTGSGIDMSDILRYLQNLYEYNVLLREKFVVAQSMLEALTTKASSPERKGQTQH
ncbi:PREDICTED: uncharacterized protein LOC104590676 isoform X2 [Nelumbo nucifera]|uniref:Uncharacterized protein LOC104590676 isoform X2 n=1 Tax=Nelumbo nucifera TaxID=4432 RepID=A0A1U7Z5U4_NELNU|nr:PREDICTED: uncharacterized protein LOC104590676 isoform X2 [Nelumbo nucifera]